MPDPILIPWDMCERCGGQLVPCPYCSAYYCDAEEFEIHREFCPKWPDEYDDDYDLPEEERGDE